jgi:type IV secretory pathway VirJ component
LDDGELSEELVSDMQQQAKQISRNRRSKCDTPRVLVGMFDDGYVNHVDMLISMAVSRTLAKMKRPSTDEDYTTINIPLICERHVELWPT